MKQRNPLHRLLFKCFISALLYVGCKEKESTICTTCDPITPNTDLSLQFGDETVHFDVYYGDGDIYKEHNALSIAQPRLNETQLSAVISTLGITDYVQLNNLNPVGLGYFTRNTGKLKSQLPEVSSSLGYILYHERNGNLETRVFLKNDHGEVKGVKSLELKVKFLASNDLHVISQHLSETHDVNVHALLMIRDKGVPTINERANDFTQEFQKVYSMRLGKRENVGCGAPCAYNPDRDRCVARESGNRGEYWECYHNPADDCPKEDAEQQLINAGLLNVANSIDDNVLYNFRDSFLLNSVKGRKYIDDFYALGSILAQTGISIQLAQDGFNLGSSTIIPLLNAILTNPTSTSVLYTTAERDAIVAYLNSLKTVSTDPQFQQILDDVIADINAYTNQSISFIVNDFGN